MSCSLSAPSARPNANSSPIIGICGSDGFRPSYSLGSQEATSGDDTRRRFAFVVLFDQCHVDVAPERDHSIAAVILVGRHNSTVARRCEHGLVAVVPSHAERGQRFSRPSTLP